MKRREFITLLGGAAARGRSRRARSSRADAAHRRAPRYRRETIRTLKPAMRYSARRCSNWVGPKDATSRSSTVGPSGDVDLARRYAAELVALGPDVILVGGATNVAALQQATRTIPIVFAGLTDPVGAGFVESLARPGGNTTGFTSFEYGLSTKWLELLKEIAPRVTRVGVLREQGSSVGIGLWAAMQGAAPSLGMELRPIGARDASEIERGVAAFARAPNGGMIVTVGGLSSRIVT